MDPRALIVGFVSGLVFFFNGASSGYALTPDAEVSTPGISEKLGALIPLDIEVSDETGIKSRMGAFVKRPVVLTIVYYGCTKYCPDLLAGLGSAMQRVKSVPGKDFDLVTVSLDEKDGPMAAQRKKREVALSSNQGLPEGAWRFLTADKDNIERLMRAVGLGYKRQADGFIHPSFVVVLSGSGRIIRYLYGADVLPADLEMAVSEAVMERTGPTIPKPLLLCFRYEPGKGYVLDWLRIAGLTVLGSVASFFVYASTGRASRKRRKRG